MRLIMPVSLDRTNMFKCFPMLTKSQNWILNRFEPVVLLVNLGTKTKIVVQTLFNNISFVLAHHPCCEIEDQSQP